MDVLFFLKERSNFLRKFYEDASNSFLETQRKIRDRESPFDGYPAGYDPEWGEPPFLAEWQQAEDSIDFLGQAAVSFLAASLVLYLDEFRQEFGRFNKVPEFDEKLARQEGQLAGYRKWFSAMGTDLSGSGCDLGVIEQVVLARNSVQHPKSIGLMTLQPSKKQKAKYPRPFFVHPMEEHLVAKHLEDGDEPHHYLFWMHVSRERLWSAIEEIEKLCAWIDKSFFSWSSAHESE